MKKANETNLISDAIYPFDEYCAISDRACWGDDLDDIKAIDGALAEKIAAKNNVVITGKLQANVLYIFRWTKAGDKLVPCHVSMKPKTAVNIEHGSNRYGSGAIRSEL